MVRRRSRDRQTKPAAGDTSEGAGAGQSGGGRTGDERVFEVGAGVAAALYSAMSLIYFLPAFMPGRHIFGTDYTQVGYIMYEFARQRIAEGSLPGWVPHIFGGLPMFANPGSVFYPIRLLSNALFPGTWAMPVTYVFQFAIAGFGMYLLARELRCRSWVAFVAGVAFMFTGITMSAVHAGHDGRIIVATFAPLFLFFLHRGVRTGALPWFAGAAATLGFALLSFQIQSNYYLLLSGAAWAVFALVHLGIVRTPRALASRSALGLAAVAFGFAMAAVNFLPFREYVADSPRGEARGYEYSTSWALPPVELVGMAVPEHSGVLGDYAGANPFKLNNEYMGATVLLLLVLGFLFARRDRYWWFFAGLAAFMTLIALGGHTPAYRLFYEVLPGTQRFRAPSIAFFMVATALVAMAAVTLERLAEARQARIEPASRQGSRKVQADRSGRLLAWGLGACVIIAVLAAIIATAMPGHPQAAAGFARFALVTAVAAILVWLWWLAALPTIAFAALLAVLTATDLSVVNRQFFSTVDAPERMFGMDSFIRYLAEAPRPNRVWILPAPDWHDNNVLMLYGVEQAGGQHGNQLQRFNEYAGTTGETYVNWMNMFSHSNFVNAANVRYVVSRVDLQLTGEDTLTMRQRHREGGFIYENLRAMPRAWLVGSVIATADTMAALEILRDDGFDIAASAVVYGPDPGLSDQPLEGAVEIHEHTPDRVVLSARSNRPALLVLSDNFHRDWVATVNGTEVPILRTNHTFRGVVVGAGASEVVFEFTPRALHAGFRIYLVTMLLLAGYCAWLLVACLRRRTA
jgi:hypothetical protein